MTIRRDASSLWTCEYIGRALEPVRDKQPGTPGTHSHLVALFCCTKARAANSIEIRTYECGIFVASIRTKG